MGRPPRVKSLSKSEGAAIGISDFPNFSITGSITGMRERFYGRNALLVRCGSYIYNVTGRPDIYYGRAK